MDSSLSVTTYLNSFILISSMFFYFNFFVIAFFYFAAYAAFFFNRPSRTAEITVPATSATRYITAFPTTGNTKIPPCGAISVQSNAMEIAPATADPTIQEGSTRRGTEMLRMESHLL